MADQYGPPRRPHEDENERLDRNLNELLQGLRVALPGVQVLFAFLLTLPFQAGFERVTDTQRDIYFIVLLATALSSAFLIGPSARHRMRFREGDKKYVVMSANRLAIWGLALLAIAITGATLLVCDYLYSTKTAIVASAVVGLAIAWLWFTSPLLRAIRQGG